MVVPSVPIYINRVPDIHQGVCPHGALPSDAAGLRYNAAVNYLEGLNSPQRAAVEAIEGPVLVIAGPGSGKTRVIVHRLAYLIKRVGVNPRRIMAVTFTNKAARELRDRTSRLLGSPDSSVTLGTFHAIAARILRIEHEHAELDRDFVIYDASDQLSLVKRSMADIGVDSKRFGPGAIRNAISAGKSKLLRPEAFGEAKANYFDEVVHRIYLRYQEILAQSNALDFDDLLMRLVYLLADNDQVLERYRERYVHVMIDEFQDTNEAQYRIAKLLSAPPQAESLVPGVKANLFAVGDPDQSIYSWRYADIANILNFERDYPGATVIKLEQNYRSTATILEAAGTVIEANQQRKAKELWTDNGKGHPIGVIDALNEQDEAASVVSEINRLIGEEGKRYADMAVLYRTNAQSRPIEEAFVRYGFPYHLVGATRFYERREVKDVVAYLRLVRNPFDDVSLQRVINVPARGIGNRTLDELGRWASGRRVPIYAAIQLLGDAEAAADLNLSPRAAKALTTFRELIDSLAQESKSVSTADLVTLVVEMSGYRDHLLASDDLGEERLENVMELRSVAEEFGAMTPTEGLTAFLEQVALVSDTDDLGDKPNSATLITLHQAKGLEFPVVFIVGMEEGVLPHNRSFDNSDQMEEERRLAYVGMTRAEERLYLLRAYRRSSMGMRNTNPPSRFLTDIPRGLTASQSKRRGSWHAFESSEPDPVRLKGWDDTSPQTRRSQGRNSSETLDHTPTSQRRVTRRPAAPSTRGNVSNRLSEPQPSTPGFSSGDRVHHPHFGDGVVVNSTPSGSDQEVVVAFPGDVGVKRLLLSFAPLEKL